MLDYLAEFEGVDVWEMFNVILYWLKKSIQMFPLLAIDQGNILLFECMLAFDSLEQEHITNRMSSCCAAVVLADSQMRVSSLQLGDCRASEMFQKPQNSPELDSTEELSFRRVKDTCLAECTLLNFRSN